MGRVCVLRGLALVLVLQALRAQIQAVDPSPAGPSTTPAQNAQHTASHRLNDTHADPASHTHTGQTVAHTLAHAGEVVTHTLVDAGEALRESVEGLIDSAEDAVMEMVHDGQQVVEQLMHTRPHILLDRFERCVERVWRNTGMLRRSGLRGIAGVMMMTLGGHFGRCVVVAHTVRVTGWPILRRALHELGESWKRARQIVEREVGHVKSPTELLHAVEYELKARGHTHTHKQKRTQSVRALMVEAQKKLDDGVLDAQEQRESIRKAHVDVQRLQREAWVLNQAIGSFSAVSAAIDFMKLKDVTKSIYTALVAVVASANSVTVGKLSMTFDLGAILSNDLHFLVTTILERIHSKELAQILPPETRKLLGAVIGVVGAVKGLVIVHALLPVMSLRFSSAALGASWLVDAVAAFVDPRLQARGWEPIQGHAWYVPLHLGLTWAGFQLQARVRDVDALPAAINTVLKPLQAAEAKLKRLGNIFGKT